MNKTTKIRKKYAVVLASTGNYTTIKNTLDSIYFSSQNKKTFDLYVIGNGLDDNTKYEIVGYLNSKLAPIKNFVLIPKSSLSVAFNLGLALTSDYSWVLVLHDNIVFQNTPQEVLELPQNKKPGIQYNAAQQSGATMGFHVGATSTQAINRYRNKKTEVKRNNFLDVMSEWSENNNVDISALVSSLPGVDYKKQYVSAIVTKKCGMPCLIEGCILISKKCRDKIGYFNEKAEDYVYCAEYTQRALKSALNIGYLPDYFCQHISASADTDTPEEKEFKTDNANTVLIKNPKTGFVNSQWEKVMKDILPAVEKTKIVNLK